MMGSDPQKQSLYDSGCFQGCCLSWLFGIFAVICMQMQNTQSGKYGYMKGMGIMMIISGVILVIVGFAVFLPNNHYCSSYYYSSNSGYSCTSYTTSSIWIVFVIIGVIYSSLGGFLTSHAKKRFNELVHNPAAPL
jgi:hypothetical protein